MRRSRLCLVLLMVASSFAVAPAAHASPESDFTARINRERASRGLRTLRVRADLTAVAERHSARMAREGRIYHNPSLRSQIDGWTVIGENVGRGGSVGSIHRAFMRSSSHRSVILNPRYNQLGVGVTKRGSTLYVSQVFVRRGSTQATTSESRTITSERRTTRRVRATTRVSRSRRAPAIVRRPAESEPVRTRPPVEEPQTVALLVRMMLEDSDL